MYFPRALEDRVRNVAATFPVLLLTGPRQVGKSTLLQRLAEPERTVVTLDQPLLRQLAQNDPELFLQRYRPPILIDEVQYAPQLFDFIKIAVDEAKMPGAYWLTGSQMFNIMEHASQSLAGRVGILNLFGLSQSEIRRDIAPPFSVDPDTLIARSQRLARETSIEVFTRIWRGSMPRLWERDDVDPATYFESYIQTYLSRDIRQLTQVADEGSFLRFTQIVAARTAGPVNYQELAIETGVSAPTAKHWLSLLASSGVVLLLQPFHHNLLKRVVKRPRMYFLDTGLCCHLTRWSSPEVLADGAMAGAMFETYVVSEIYKSYVNNGRPAPLYHYRDLDQREIDVVLNKDGVVTPIEIKTSTAPRGATKHFHVLDALHSDEASAAGRLGNGAVVCLAQDVHPLDRDNWLVPAPLI